MPRRSVFWAALAVVLAGHAAILSWLRPGFEQAPRGQAGAPVAILHVRTVPSAAVGEAPAATLPAPPGGKHLPQEATPAAGAGRAPAAEVVSAAEPTVPAPPADPWAGYLPRGALTQAPRPLGQVQVPFPPEVRGVVDLKVRITLFIDAAGVVRRVRLDTPDVPPMFARTIVETFEQAPFSPGVQGTEPVPSQMRLEVEFDAGAPRRP